MLREATRILTPERNAVAVWCGGGGPTPTFAWLADRMNRDGLSFFIPLFGTSGTWRRLEVSPAA